MTYKAPEAILRAIKATYETYYAGSLSTVASTWAADYPSEPAIPLEDFAQRKLVADTSIFTAFSLFPALGIGYNGVRPQEGGLTSQQGQEDYVLEIPLVYFLRGIDGEQLAYIILRHTEATFDMFKRFPSLEADGTLFRMEGSPAITPSANSYPSGGNALVKALLVELRIRLPNWGYL